MMISLARVKSGDLQMTHGRSASHSSSSAIAAGGAMSRGIFTAAAVVPHVERLLWCHGRVGRRHVERPTTDDAHMPDEDTIRASVRQAMGFCGCGRRIWCVMATMS